MRVLSFIAAVLVAALAAAPAVAQSCVALGDIVEQPTPGFLRNDTPNLVLDYDGDRTPVTVVSFTRSRLSFRVPDTVLPVQGRPAFVLHLPSSGGDRNVATLRLCASDGGTGGGSVNADLTIGTPQPAVRATRNDVAAPSGGPEYIAFGSAAQMARAELVVQAAGGTILRRQELGSLGQVMLTVDLNGAISLDRLIVRLAREGIDISIDRHTVYRPASAGRAYAAQMVGLSPEQACGLPRQVDIGVIDGPVDVSSPALAGVAIDVISVLNPRQKSGSSNHATGIAALIASQGTGGAPRGIAPGARLHAVAAFERAGGRDLARLENIAEAIDVLLSRNVDIINMSLEGRRNAALARVIEIADARGAVMVAAAGNGGAPQVAYPAADPHVIAVTAIDARKRLYARSSFGAEVDFAAPGVDVLVPRRSGTGFDSGTSYAAAVATGLIAYDIAEGVRSADRLRAVLRARAEDLGEAGRDARFGWGLMRRPGC